MLNAPELSAIRKQSWDSFGAPVLVGQKRASGRLGASGVQQHHFLTSRLLARVVETRRVTSTGMTSV